jgi:hypothetical protein
MHGDVLCRYGYDHGYCHQDCADQDRDRYAVGGAHDRHDDLRPRELWLSGDMRLSILLYKYMHQGFRQLDTCRRESRDVTRRKSQSAAGALAIASFLSFLAL